MLFRFFGFVQSLYNFFSSSTHRWEKLKNAIPDGGFLVKSLSKTRWFARAEAIKSLHCGYQNINTLLRNISESEKDNKTTQPEAKNLYSQMNEYDTTLMAVIWDVILKRFNSISKMLQDPSIIQITFRIQQRSSEWI